MKRSWLFFYWVVQGTWGFLQTMVGFCLFLRYRRYPREIFNGAIHTRWNRDSGISLGLFIFTPEREERSSNLRVHEFGHTIQSMMFGPLYLLAVGLPSWIWANFPACVQWRKCKGIPYSWFVIEHWADKLGEAVLKRDDIFDNQ